MLYATVRMQFMIKSSKLHNNRLWAWGPIWDWATLQCVYPHSDPQQYEYYLTTLHDHKVGLLTGAYFILSATFDLLNTQRVLQRVHVAVAPGYDCTFDVHCHDDVPVMFRWVALRASLSRQP